MEVPDWRDKVSQSVKFRISSYLQGNAFPSGLLRAAALLYITEDGIKIGKLRNGPRNDVLPLFLNGEMQRFTADARPMP